MSLEEIKAAINEMFELLVTKEGWDVQGFGIIMDVRANEEGEFKKYTVVTTENLPEQSIEFGLNLMRQKVRERLTNNIVNEAKINHPPDPETQDKLQQAINDIEKSFSQDNEDEDLSPV